MRQQCEAWDMCGLHLKHNSWLWDNIFVTLWLNVQASQDSDFWAWSDGGVRDEDHKEESVTKITDTRGNPAAGISEHGKNQSHDPWAESGGEETQRLSANSSFKPVIVGHREMKQFLFYLCMCCHMWRHLGQRMRRNINVQYIALFLWTHFCHDSPSGRRCSLAVCMLYKRMEAYACAEVQNHWFFFFPRPQHSIQICVSSADLKRCPFCIVYICSTSGRDCPPIDATKKTLVWSIECSGKKKVLATGAESPWVLYQHHL